MATTKFELAREIMLRMLHTPYIWMGNDPMAGFDCSGAVVEVLQSVDILPRGDWTAEDLRRKFAANHVQVPRPGCLVWWPSQHDSSRAAHIEMVFDVIGSLIVTWGASGGNKRTTSLAQAIKQDAYIKLRPLRPGWKWAADPFRQLP